jgi:hypothetical protein
MSQYFTPEEPRPGGCWTCTHWHGETAGGGRHAVCRKDAQPLILGQPDYGCSAWEREPGADDEIRLADDCQC